MIEGTGLLGPERPGRCRDKAGARWWKSERKEEGIWDRGRGGDSGTLTRGKKDRFRFQVRARSRASHTLKRGRGGKSDPSEKSSRTLSRTRPRVARGEVTEKCKRGQESLSE